MLSFKDSKFPEIVVCQRKIDSKPFNLNIVKDKENPKYKLPSQIAKYSDDIFGVHKTSTVFNNVNIRLNDLKVNENDVELVYGFTTYFDSLITNRAMDYKLPNSKTIREIYEPGPMISDLKDSKFSNHLGFNGLIELSKGELIFVHRSMGVSIGKSTWSQSVGAITLKSGKVLNMMPTIAASTVIYLNNL